MVGVIEGWGVGCVLLWGWKQARRSVIAQTCSAYTYARSLDRLGFHCCSGGGRRLGDSGCLFRFALALRLGLDVGLDQFL